MFNTSRRGRLASVMATVVATSVLAVTAGAAAGAQPGAGSVTAASSTASAVSKPVLSNEYGKMTSRIEGSFGKGGTVTGTFTPRRFVMEDGALAAVGMLSATLTKAGGKEVGTKDKVVTIPVASAEGTQVGKISTRAGDCEILHLTLGPLDLNLLGLKVHLDRVVLNIDAEPGPGNLLGNLLCAVAGLLDNTGVLPQIRQILNAILGILRL
jgi:hypothetical protein